jgi:hypothetical protein
LCHRARLTVVWMKSWLPQRDMEPFDPFDPLLWEAKGWAVACAGRVGLDTRLRALARSARGRGEEVR